MTSTSSPSDTHLDRDGLPAWDDHPWAALAPLATDCSADACVVGLGGSGVAAITELLDHGLRVIGIDAERVAGGAAGRNGGFLLGGGAPFHHDAAREWGVDAALAAHHGTVEELARIEAAAPDLVRRVGSFRRAASAAERDDCERQFEVMRDHGLEVERYQGPDGSGLLLPGDAAFQPLNYTRRQALAAIQRGALLYERTTATAVESGAVVTAAGVIRAPLIVVAVDGGLARLLPALADRVRSVRLQMLATAPTDEVLIPRPVSSNYGYDYWQQLPDGRVVVGGGRDRFVADEETDQRLATAPIQGYLDQLLRQVIGVATAPVTHRWAGIVGYTPDERPVVSQVMAGVWAVGGYSGTGNLVGRRVARGVVQQALDGHTALLAGFVA